MIKKVKKINYTNDEGQTSVRTYKVTTADDEILFVPLKAENRHYQAVLEWVDEGNTIEEAD
tara:strand:+ start:483 stop:665 length:183 start_codon:yes stop_codon:yes gene_type:complete